MSAYMHGHLDGGGPLSPRRRMPQPPTLLTTSLNNAAHLQHSLAAPGGQVPMSATSLSSPFALASASPSSVSPGDAMRYASPVIAYNPQQWAGNGSDQYLQAGQPGGQTIRYAPRLQGPDEPVRSPPPPYSSQPLEASPADSTPSTSFSPQYVPSSASTTMSPMWASENASPQTPYMRSPHTYPEPLATLRQTAADNLINVQPVAPPAARRAASTGDMYRTQPARSPLAFQTETSEPRHGFPLPPPPPGPPPRAGRSISLSRAGEAPAVTSHAQLAPRTRRPPALGTELGPVPPTPANWDENAPDPLVPQEQVQEYSRGPEALHVRTEGLGDGGAQDEAVASSSSGEPSATGRRGSNSALVRSPAMRNRSSSALRDRRTASRAGKRSDSDELISPVESQLAQPLDNLVLSSKKSSLAERRRSMRLTPRSGGSFQGLDATLGSARSPPQSGRMFPSVPNSARSNVIEQIVDQERYEDSSTPTPGNQARKASSMDDQPALLVSPRAPLSAAAQSLLAPPTPRSAPIRPISHLLHLPNDDDDLRLQPILSPESTHSLLDLHSNPSPRATPLQNKDPFLAQSIERHRAFAEKEAAASSDGERLRLFVQFMQEESKIRRERYADVFDQERIKPSDLTSKMFMKSTTFIPEPPQSAPLPGRSNSILGADRRASTSSSGTSFGDSPQIRSRASTDAIPEQQLLKLDTSADTIRRREGAFVPALSPIASMSAVTGRDELESRGRAPSRWWEEGSNSSGRGFDVMSRSKRESKYMSALIEKDIFGESDAAGPSAAPPGYMGPNGFPDEKAALKAGHSPHSSYSLPKRAPFENRPGVLDVSRFTTLPPPFPRHHPAINNSHPDLADTRAILRTLNDVGEATTAKEEFETQSVQKRSRADSWAAHQQSIHEQEMQFRINQNDITRQEFDDANFALQDKIHSTKKQAIQASFDLYQSVVVTPVHSFYSTRIAIANNTIEQLTSRLLERSGTPLPDQPQTEGDSQPELLERLTLLKWLFEARESLHKSQFDVLTKRNELYKELVLLPYSAPGAADNPANKAKAAEAAKFFDKDYFTRERELLTSSLARWTSFHDTIRAAVTTGVQSQLSAFWDIAPQIQDILQQITASADLRDANNALAGMHGLEQLEILIPRHEVDENSSYWDHPLRYLYSVMSHAEASTRQFVEAQVSLWCLEQEIREGLVGARAKADGHMPQAAIDQELKRGVEELKDNVEAVESQWAEGLGSEFESVKLAVRDHLEATGGWDEDLQEMT